mgnify:CR=1 FL=1
MRSVSLGVPLAGQELQWVMDALCEIERASYEEIAEVADAFTISGTLTETRILDVDSPSAANLAAVLGTLIADLKRRGTKRDI